VAPAPSSRKTPTLRVIEGGADGQVFDQFLGLVGRSPPGEFVFTLELEQKVEALGLKVLEHSRAQRPAPTASETVSLQVLNPVAKRDFSLAELTQLVQRDAALTAGVLKVANSPAFRGSDEFETVRDGVTRLGAEEVGRVAGTFAARALFAPQSRHEPR